MRRGAFFLGKAIHRHAAVLADVCSTHMAVTHGVVCALPAVCATRAGPCRSSCCRGSGDRRTGCAQPGDAAGGKHRRAPGLLGAGEGSPQAGEAACYWRAPHIAAANGGRRAGPACGASHAGGSWCRRSCATGSSMGRGCSRQHSGQAGRAAAAANNTAGHLRRSGPSCRDAPPPGLQARTRPLVWSRDACSAPGMHNLFLAAPNPRAGSKTRTGACYHLLHRLLRVLCTCSMDSGMRGALMVARAVAAAQQSAAQAAPNGYVERLARRRWAQVRMLVDFHKAHR